MSAAATLPVNAPLDITKMTTSPAVAAPVATVTPDIANPPPIPVWTSLANSCVAGCAAWMVAHPFEVLKNTIVLSPPEATLMSSVQKAMGNPYKGISGGIMRQVVYATSRLGLYNPIKNAIVPAGQEPNMAQRAAAGALSGAAAACISSPVEVCLVLMTKSQTPLSIVGAAREVYGESGVKGFWRGVVPLTNRAAIVGVCQVAMYDQSRSWITHYSNQKVLASGGDKSAGYSKNQIVMYASVFTGLFYSFITMPIELARVKLSCYKKPTPDAKVPGMVGILAHTVKTEGMGSIFKSFVPYFGRCTSHTICCFFALEQLNGWTRDYYYGKQQQKVEKQ